MNRLNACLTLRLLKGIGPITAKKLVTAYGSPEAVFDSNSIPKESPNARLKALIREAAAVQEEVAALANWIHKEGLRVLLWGEDHYPPLLANCPDAPLLLFQQGSFQWEHSRFIAVVGTRNPSHYGRESCQALLKALQVYDPVIVSGLAFGIDAIAHTEALKAGLKTIACLPNAFGESIYPTAHLSLAAEIAKEGALLSDFLPNQLFDKSKFVQRNRIIAGLCQATLVIESKVKGGSLITANFASQYQRELFALPGAISSVKSQGCHRLIQSQQAQLLDSAEIVAQTLGWGRAPTGNQKQLPLDLEGKEQHIYDYLRSNGRQNLDSLARNLQMSISEAAVLLMQLEMKKHIRPSPGKYFEVR